MQSRVKFNRVPETVLVKVWGCFGAEPGQVQQGSKEGSGESSGRLLVKSQVKFNRVPEKVPEKVWEGGFAEPGQVQQRPGKGFGEGLGCLGAEPGQVQQVLRPINSRKPS